MASQHVFERPDILIEAQEHGTLGMWVIHCFTLLTAKARRICRSRFTGCCRQDKFLVDYKIVPWGWKKLDLFRVIHCIGGKSVSKSFTILL
jgi:hypothetical protein